MATLKTKNPLKIDTRDFEIQNDRSEEAHTAYELCKTKGIDIDPAPLQNIEAEVNSFAQETQRIKGIWMKNIQSIADALLVSSAEFDSAYESMADSEIDKYIKGYFPEKTQFLEKLQEFYEETSSGYLSQEERNKFITELNSIDENLKLKRYKELLPIFTNMQKRVERMPIAET